MGKSRYGQWEPCESRGSSRVLRETPGEIPGANSLERVHREALREPVAVGPNDRQICARSSRWQAAAFEELKQMT
jgi:hypothetical protein